MEMNNYSLRKLVRYAKSGLMALAVLGLSFQAQAQMSGTYTIDKGSAASSTNFQSFDAAVDALRGISRSDGGPSLGGGVNGAVVINVVANSGPYTEKISIPSISGASSSNTITFNGNGETIQASGSSSARHVIQLNGADYITLKDLHVKTTNSTYGWGIWFKSNADHNTIENCDIDITSITASSYSSNGYYSAGIVFSPSSSYSYGGNARSNNGKYNLIQGNYIHGRTSGYGMYLGISVVGPSSTGYHQYNEIRDNEIHAFRYYGIYHYYSSGEIIDNNEIHRTGMVQYSAYYFYGIYNYYSQAEISNNKLHTPFPNGHAYTYSYVYPIYNYWYSMPGNLRNKIYNNVVYDINAGGYWYYGIFNGYANSDIYHNTVAFTGSSGSNGAYGIYAYDYLNTTPTTYIKNNIVYVMNGGTRRCFYFNGNSGAFVIDNNSFYKTSGDIAYFNGTYQNLSNWQSAFGGVFDQNSAVVDPNFANINNGQLEPRVLELDGAGDAVGITTDINGNPRNMTNPDIGAVEFDIPINVSNINFPTTLCQGNLQEVEVTITNNSSLNLADFAVVFSIDGVSVATENYPSTLNSGASATFTFNTEVTTDVLGTFKLEAYVRGKDPVVDVTYTVNPAPIGSYVSKGSPFVGAFNSGDGQDPDIVAYGDNIRYSIEPPTGYTNGDFNSSWDFDFWELVTPNGTSAGGTHTKTNPTGGNNAVSSFNPVIGQSDSTFLLRYAIHSMVNGCVAPVVERQVFVAPRPVAAFAANTVCEGDAMSFDNNTSISSGSVDYLWRFGDGDSTVLINPDHVYPAAGTYTVDLVAVSNYGYMDMETMTVSINENPTAEFGASNVCDGDMMPFTDGSIIPAGTPTYEWDFGDGSALGSGPNPTHQYATTGVYEVTMRVTANGCTGEVSNYVTYAPRAVPDFTPSVVDCNNEEVTFDNKTTLSEGQVGYSWDFGDNTSSTTENPAHTYAIYGNIDVTLTATTDFGCVDQVTKQITLTEAPIADFAISSLCDKDNADFTNNSSEPANANTSYEWTFSDGSTYNTMDVSRSFPSVGPYDVTLLAIADNGCTDELTMTISVDEEPTAEFYADDVCEGADMEFLNASTGNMGNFTSSWDFGGGNTSMDLNPVMSLPAGAHTVTLTVTTPSGCESDVTKNVTVIENPTITNVMVESAEMGDGSMNVIATVTPNDVDYIVFWGDGGRAQGSTTNGQIAETYAYITDGKYPVTLRLSHQECMVETSAEASVLRTGLINLNAGQLKAYPNPSNGKFNLDLSGLNEGPVTITVHASNGQVVNGNTVINGNSAQLDLSTEAAGVYLVTVVTDSGVYNARVTLNK